METIPPVAPRPGQAPASSSSQLLPLGAVVKAFRREADLTQAQLAERSGLHSTYISHIERGARNPTWTVLTKLCKGLGVPRWMLVKRVDEGRRG
ncbi:MAG TPA: helix-turn-helix transcriptional regulator [Solirubrobacterales bacterium]|nr:helix-turn-helix transcriptional regulator [Solirubrobacterales bacterium]